MEDRFTFPVTLAPEEGGGFVVGFPDLPEALTSGGDLDEALTMAEDCLCEAIAGRIDDGGEIPEPSAHEDGHAIALPECMVLKAIQYLESSSQNL